MGLSFQAISGNRYERRKPLPVAGFLYVIKPVHDFIIYFYTSMDTVKKIPVKWVWIIIVVGGAIFCFYWFSLRVEGIKKQCYQYSVSYGQNYEACLTQNGL